MRCPLCGRASPSAWLWARRWACWRRGHPGGGLGVYGALLCLTLWSGVGGEWLLPALCGSAVLLPAGEGDKRALRARWGGAAQVLIAFCDRNGSGGAAVF